MPGTLRMLLVSMSVGMAVPAHAGEFDNLAQSRFVHCAFYKSYEVDPRTGDLLMVEGKSDSLTHLQRIGNARERARAIYTRSAGASEVLVIETGKRLHFIDRAAGLITQTTVYGCLEHDERRGHCINYGAMQARHFDSRALTDPDGVFEAIRTAADPGFCDYSFIGVQEAARREQ